MRNNYNFLNKLILANNLFIKSITRSFIMLNAAMENENKSSTNISIFFFEIMVAEHGACNHDLRKDIKILVRPFLFSIKVFNIMKL